MLKFRPAEVKNILTIRTDRFGEFILTLPAIEALKAHFSSARLVLMAHPYSAGLVRDNPNLDEIIEYDDKNFSSFKKSIWLISQLRKRKFDLVVIFNPKRKFNLLAFLAGIPIRVGYDRKWGFLLNKKTKDSKFLGLKHEVEYNFDLLRIIGVNPKAIIFPIVTNQAEKYSLEKLLAGCGISNASNFIVIHPWSSNPLKQWPLFSFSSLAEKLSDGFSLPVVLVGAKEAQTAADNLTNEISGKVINLTGKISLRELALLLKQAKVLITNDSGPMHLSAAVGTPVVALFRKIPPAVSARRWGPVGDIHIVIDKEKIEDITVNEVYDAVKKILSR